METDQNIPANVSEASAKRFKSDSLNLNDSVAKIYGEADIRILFNTLVFASLKHSNQRRKDPQKTRVADLATLQAALLHDTLEDTDTTFEELVDNFGLHVAKIVQEVSDDSLLPKMERKKLQIQNAPFLTQEAKQVRLADKLYNLTDIMSQVPVGWTEERVHEYFIWARNVTSNCLGTNPELEVHLKKIYSQGQFLFQGKLYPCIPIVKEDVTQGDDVDTIAIN